MDLTQYAAYFGYAVLACSVGHKLVEAVRPIAAATASKRDDGVLDWIDSALKTVETVVGSLSVFNKNVK